MSYFDELVAKYKNMHYGELSARNPSAIDNVLRTQQGLLGNSLQFQNPNQRFIENIPTGEQQFIDTPTGKVAQNRFRMGADGNPIFGVPGQLNADGSVGGGAAFYDSSIDYGEPGSAGVLPVDPVTGLVSNQTTARQGGGDGDLRRQFDNTAENYNFAGGSFVGDTLNEDGTIKYGIHGYLPGGLIAQGITSPANQLKTLKSLSEQNMAYSGQKGNVTGAAQDISDLANEVREAAQRSGDAKTAQEAAKLSYGYAGYSRDTAQAAMDTAKAKAEANKKTGFNLGDFIGGLLSGGGGKKEDKATPKSKPSPGSGSGAMGDPQRKSGGGDKGQGGGSSPSAGGGGGVNTGGGGFSGRY